MGNKRSVLFELDTFIYIQKLRAEILKEGKEYSFTQAVNDLLKEAIEARKRG